MQFLNVSEIGRFYVELANEVRDLSWPDMKTSHATSDHVSVTQPQRRVRENRPLIALVIKSLKLAISLF
jgi:hypothetical protein